MHRRVSQGQSPRDKTTAHRAPVRGRLRGTIQSQPCLPIPVARDRRIFIGCLSGIYATGVLSIGTEAGAFRSSDSGPVLSSPLRRRNFGMVNGSSKRTTDTTTSSPVTMANGSLGSAPWGELLGLSSPGSPLTIGEGMQILSIYTHGAPCGPPAALRGDAPITLETVADWRQALAEAAPSPLTDALRSALMIYEAILAPTIARRRLSDAAERWRACALMDGLRRDFAELPGNGPAAESIPGLLNRLQKAKTALGKIRCPGHERTSIRRRGRIFRNLGRLFRPFNAWGELSKRAEAFYSQGRPLDAMRLRETLEGLTGAFLSEPQLRRINALDSDLSHFTASPPGLAEIQSALQTLKDALAKSNRRPRLRAQIESCMATLDQAEYLRSDAEQRVWILQFEPVLRNVRCGVMSLSKQTSSIGTTAHECAAILDGYLEYRARRERVRIYLTLLQAGPAPKIPTTEMRRQLTQMERLSTRWFRAGLRITTAQLERVAPLLRLADYQHLAANLEGIQRKLADSGSSMPWAEVQVFIDNVAACSTPAPTGETLAFLLRACAAVRAVTPEPPAPAENPCHAAAEALDQLARWIDTLREFTQRRLATFDTTQRIAFQDFLQTHNFAVDPPDARDVDCLVAWLIVLPASQRDTVLEFLHLGPVRSAVLHLALQIAAAETAVRRSPRLSPARLAQVAVVVEACDATLGAILLEEMFTPHLFASELPAFDARLQGLRRRYDGRSFSFAKWRKMLSRVDRGGHVDVSPTPFFESPQVGGVRREQSRRLAALELLHSLWRAGSLEESDYRQAIAQHWRRKTTCADRFDCDRRRPSIVEQMLLHAAQTQAAAAEAGDSPPSLAHLVWGAWTYIHAAQEVNIRWQGHVPTGEPRRRHHRAPERIEASQPHEMIEHVSVLAMKFYDLENLVLRARRHARAVTEEELHEIRAVDLLLFDLFGDEGLLLASRVYATPLAQTTRQALAALRTLAPHHADAQRARGVLELLAPFYDDYRPWAEALSFAPWAKGANEAVSRWRDLLDALRVTARGMARAPMLAGPRATAWAGLSELLENRQQHLRLQLAMRVAVERSDPTCRHLCASRPLLAQIDAERVGLARRRRLHPRSEAAIIAQKLDHRRQCVLAARPANDCLGAATEALAEDCLRLLELHSAATPDPQVRESTLACGAQIESRFREIRSRVRGSAPGSVAPCDARLLAVADAAAAAARDLVDGFYAPKQRKGLRSLIPLRWGEPLDDTLSRA